MTRFLSTLRESNGAMTLELVRDDAGSSSVTQARPQRNRKRPRRRSSKELQRFNDESCCSPPRCPQRESRVQHPQHASLPLARSVSAPLLVLENEEASSSSGCTTKVTKELSRSRRRPSMLAKRRSSMELLAMLDSVEQICAGINNSSARKQKTADGQYNIITTRSNFFKPPFFYVSPNTNF